MRLPHLITVYDFANPVFRGFSSRDPFGDAASPSVITDDWLNSNIVDFVGLALPCLIEFDSATDISDPISQVPIAGGRGNFRVYSAVRQRAYFNCTTSPFHYRRLRKLFAIFRRQRIFFNTPGDLSTRPPIDVNSDTAFTEDDLRVLVNQPPPTPGLSAYFGSPTLVGTSLEGQSPLDELNARNRLTVSSGKRWNNSRRKTRSNIKGRNWSELIPDGFELGVFERSARWDGSEGKIFNPFKREVIGAAREIAGYNPGSARGLEFVNVAVRGGVMNILLELAYDRF